MHRLEEGILEPSKILFLTPSGFALRTLYCLQHIGIFHCDTRYRVTHPYWESILLIFMEEGTLQVTCQQETRMAKKGDVVLIDCRHAHEYIAMSDVRFRFFHFYGVTSADYAEMILRNPGRFLLGSADSPILRKQFQTLYHLAQAQTNTRMEQQISICIQMILAELTETAYDIRPGSNTAIDTVIRYMEDHLRENLSLEEIAAQTGFNKHYFARLFRKYTGFPLHQYFVRMKIQYARRLLLTTDDSVESIAEKCGFDNTSNFIRTFKQVSGMTPLHFRNIPL